MTLVTLCHGAATQHAGVVGSRDQVARVVRGLLLAMSRSAGVFRRYLLGLLSDSRRESMSAMLVRVSDPGTYQVFQHFITDAPWTAAPVWRHLRVTIPDRAWC